MKTKVSTATVGRAALALTVGVLWAAPTASAGSDFCNSLPPAQIRDCSCGSDNVPGTQEYKDCLAGKVTPPPADAPAPGAPAPSP
jgi:hypothetical protein